MKIYTSITAEVKDIILAVMADGHSHSRQELLSIVKDSMEHPEQLSEGIYTGSLKLLLANGSIETLSRGSYRLNMLASQDIDIQKRIVLILNGCKEQLSKCCNNVSLLNIRSEAIQLADDVNDIIAYLNDMSAKLDNAPLPQENDQPMTLDDLDGLNFEKPDFEKDISEGIEPETIPESVEPEVDLPKPENDDGKPDDIPEEPPVEKNEPEVELKEPGQESVEPVEPTEEQNNSKKSNRKKKATS